MSGSTEKSSFGHLLGLGALLGILLVGLESKDMEHMLPQRALSLANMPSTSTNNNVTAAEVLTTSGFAEPIPCTLPLPVSTNGGHDDGNGDDGNNPRNEKCVRFFPERFFSTVATDFRQPYNDSKQVKTEHPVVHLTFQKDKSPSSDHSTTGEEDEESHVYPSTITYLHIRKCGGTTMFRSLPSRALQVPYISNNYNRQMIQNLGIVEDIYNRQQQQHQQQQQQQQQQIHALPQPTSDNDAIVFSFVRDPVIRFLSSVGQIMHMGKLNLFPACANLSEIEESLAANASSNNATLAKSQALLQCVLESVKSSSGSAESTIHHQDGSQPSYNYIDQHLLPQAYELRARSLEYDIGIQLMPMSHIASTLKTLVGAKKQNRHARSSRVADYTQGYLLEPSVLSDDMIADICNIYAVDVLLLQTTGIASSLCSSL